MLPGQLVDCTERFRHAALRYRQQAVDQLTIGIQTGGMERWADKPKDKKETQHDHLVVSLTMRHWPFCMASSSVLVAVE